MSILGSVLAGAQQRRGRPSALPPAPPADFEVELFDHIDIDLAASGSLTETQHFDLQCTYTATHEDTVTTVSCLTYYSGSGSSHKLRFGGTKAGRWTITTAGSGDAGLDGETFTVDVVAPTNALRRGYRTTISGRARYWARQAPWGAELFLPQMTMFRRPGAQGGYADLTSLLDTFMGDHGFTGVHVPSIAGQWWDSALTSSATLTSSMQLPAPATFVRLEGLIRTVNERGGHTHLWMYGDNESPVEAPTSGTVPKRGTVEMRLRRYIAARLGPLPGWSLGYGYDLDEWATASDVSLVVSDFEGFCDYGHWYGGRYSLPPTVGDKCPINDGEFTGEADTWPGTYYGWEFWPDHSTNHATMAEQQNFRDQRPDQPHMGEDRYRRRSSSRTKDFRDSDGDEPAIVELAEHGILGIAAIWGRYAGLGESPAVDNIDSQSWPNAAKWRTFGQFWSQDGNRFDRVREHDATLHGGNTHVRRTVDNRYFAAWRPPSVTQLTVDYSAAPSNVNVFRQDMNAAYGLVLIHSDRAPQSETFTMPSSGHWMVWIESTSETPVLSTDASSYNQNEDVITVTVTGGPGAPENAVGIYNQGDDPAAASALAWKYLASDSHELPQDGATSGQVTFFASFPITDKVAHLLTEPPQDVVDPVETNSTVDNTAGLFTPSLTTEALHPEGSNLVLVFAAVAREGAGAMTSVSATYGGVSMTLVDSIGIDGSASHTAEYMFALFDPPTGPNNLVVSTSPDSRTTVSIYSIANAGSLGTPAKDIFSGAETNIDLSVPSVVGDLVLRGLHWRNGGVSAEWPEDQAAIDDQGVNGQNSLSGSSWLRATTGPTPMPVTLTPGQGSNRVAVVGVAVRGV